MNSGGGDSGTSTMGLIVNVTDTNAAQAIGVGVDGRWQVTVGSYKRHRLLLERLQGRPHVGPKPQVIDIACNPVAPVGR